jgi:hypothetical protein
MLKMHSRHVAVERSVAFLLHGEKLDPSEEEHLVRCDECRRMMVEEANAELKDTGEKSDS